MTPSDTGFERPTDWLGPVFCKNAAISDFYPEPVSINTPSWVDFSFRVRLAQLLQLGQGYHITKAVRSGCIFRCC